MRPLRESVFMSDTGYIRLNKLSKDIGVCERTVRDWIKQGLICYRPSRRLVLIKQKDLDAFLSKFRDDKSQVDNLVDSITKDMA